MSIEAIAGLAAGGAGAGGSMLPPEAITFTPGASVSDVTSFQGSMTAAGASGVGSVDALEPAMKAVFSQMEQVNGQAKSVGEYAKAAQASGAEMTPGEVVDLTMRCHEFMFNCQLTSNIANRTSDGIQQLFRQQS